MHSRFATTVSLAQIAQVEDQLQTSLAGATATQDSMRAFLEQMHGLRQANEARAAQITLLASVRFRVTQYPWTAAATGKRICPSGRERAYNSPRPVEPFIHHSPYDHAAVLLLVMLVAWYWHG